MEIQQKLADAEKESQENDKALLHYQKAHEALKLDEIEYVLPLHFVY